MYSVEFIAMEPRSGTVDLDLDSVETKEEASEMALKAIERTHPTYEDVQVIGIREI